MKTFRDVIDSWPSLQAFADDLDVAYVTAQVMRHRNSIASKRWQRVVECAGLRGLEGVTYEALAAIKAGKVPPADLPLPETAKRQRTAAHA